MTAQAGKNFKIVSHGGAKDAENIKIQKISGFLRDLRVSA